MIILDTNVISALMKPKPEPLIMKWVNKYDLEYLWLTSITVMEIQYGIELLPEGKKREALHKSFHKMLLQKFQGHIIEFDESAAIITGELLAKSKKTGFHIDVRDLQIAGIARMTGADLATRNTKDFKNTNVNLINPWENSPNTK